MSNVKLDKKIVYVSGLPRSGSTLLCQLLGQHPEIYSPGHSSPLAHSLDTIRSSISNDSFMLSQLDVDFDLAYARLVNAYRSFMNGWFYETDKSCVIDKNRGWLGMIDTLNVLDPDFKILVCIRELNQVYGSIEATHQKTQLLDSGDNTASMSRYGRASAYFKDNGLVARALDGIQSAMDDIPEALKAHITYVKFERLVEAPVEVMRDVYKWLELSPFDIDPQNLSVKPSESDSHYRYKFTHNTYPEITAPKPHWVSNRIRKGIVGQHNWFYQAFYPEELTEQA